MAARERHTRQGGVVVQERAPRTRFGGAISFRGVEYATEAELARALAGAVEDAGAGESRWRCTAPGEGYVRALRELGEAS